jgi:signal transduction histidine kinase
VRAPDFGRLRWRLLVANLAVATAGVAAVVAGVWLAAPRAFERSMGMDDGMMGGGMMGGGMMGGNGGVMDPVLRSAFGDAVGSALLLGFAAAVVVAVGAAVLVATWIARPIDELAAASERVARGDFSRPVPTAQGELGDLAGAFNGMAASLAANEQRRRDLIGDVAHELRTPITSVRGYVAGLEAGVFEPGPESWRVLDEQTSRLEHLVDDLALLWQAESTDLRLDLLTLDAAAVLADAASRGLPLAETRGSSIVADPVPPVRLRADPARLAQVLDNLIANAIRYGRDGGTVRLAAIADGAFIVLSVADDGTGMTADQLAHAFDRFYRGDPSRARESGGSGLGLAISRSLVEAMDGTVRAASAGSGMGSIFEVRLPTA